MSTLHVKNLIRGATNERDTQQDPPKEKEFLKAEAVSRIAVELIKQCASSTLQQQYELAAILFGFMFALRADTIVHVTSADVKSNNNKITSVERT